MYIEGIHDYGYSRLLPPLYKFQNHLICFLTGATRILIRNMVESIYWFKDNEYVIIIEFFNPGIWLIYVII